LPIINLQIQAPESRKVNSLPYDSIEIHFDDDSSLGLSFKPNPLVLDLTNPAGFVSIQCTLCNETNEYPFNVTIEGNDKDAFKMNSEEYSFTSGSRYTDDAEITINVDSVTASEISLSLYSSQIGVATFCVIGHNYYESDPSVTEYEYIYNHSYILGYNPTKENNDNLDLQGLKDAHSAKLKEFEKTAKDYRELTKNILNAGRNLYFPNQQIILTEGSTNLLGTFSQLSPNTVYHVFLYFDNFNGKDPISAETNATTKSTPPHAELVFTFNGNPPTESEFTSTMLQIFKVPSQNLNNQGGHFSLRRLADTIYVYSDISSDTSAYDTATTNKDTIEEDTDSTVTINSVDESTYEDGAFDGDVIWITDNGIYITVNYTAAVEGELVCTAEENGANLTSDQVYEGVNSTDNEIYQFIFTATTGNYTLQDINFTDEGVTPYGTYHVSCILCNDYPGTPSCSEVQYTDYEYTGTDNNSGAEALVMAVAAYFLF